MFLKDAKDAITPGDQSCREVKTIGRRIVGFTDEVWDQYKQQIMEYVLFCKFSQNPGLADKLLETADVEIVEASPWDNVWGIGMSAAKARVSTRSSWGQNLLGKSLMEVRSRL